MKYSDVDPKAKEGIVDNTLLQNFYKLTTTSRLSFFSIELWRVRLTK